MTTVLSIQSDEQMMLLVHWILSEDGFAVVDALGQPPDPLVFRQRPDIVVMNADMDVQEKRACIEVLRALVPRLSVLDLDVEAECGTYDTGADQYLRKPFSGHDLIARVRACEF